MIPRRPRLWCSELGVWQLRFYCRRRGRTSHSTGTRDKAEAEEIAERYGSLYILGQYNPWDQPILGESALEDYLAFKRRRVKPRSFDSIVEVLRPFDKSDLYGASEARLERFLWARRLTKGTVMAQTAHRRFNTVREYASWLVAKGHLSDHVALHMEAPRVDYPEVVRFLTWDEFGRLWEALVAREKRKWLRDAVLLGISTGIRASPLLAVRYADVRDGWVNVRKTTTKTRGYSVPVTPPVESLLAEQRGTYIIGDGNKPIKTDRLSSAFSKWRDRMGWDEEYTFHVLRHTFASWHVQGGTDLYRVSNYLGHSDVRQTQKYAHLGHCHRIATAPPLLTNWGQTTKG